jgi:glutamine---fructose-6-phosphate transaminase (isomerizing)
MSSSASPELPVADAFNEDPRATRLAEIAARPAAIADAITSNFDAIRPAAALIIGARRVRLCGVGTSASAALVGEYLLRSVGIDARAVNALELVAQPANFDAGDLLVVVSHAGGRAYTARVLQRALHAGLKTIAIGERDGALRGADVRVETGTPESGVGQIGSFLSAVAIFAALAARAEPRSPLATLVPRLADGARRAVSPVAQEQATEIAAHLSGHDRRVVVTGVGAGFAAAQVAGLELRAALRLPVEVVHLEDAVHGGLLHLRADDLIIQIAPEGPVEDRQADIATLAAAAGVLRWRIGGASDDASWHLPSPGLSELLDAALGVLPVDLLVAELAGSEREPSPWDEVADSIAL